MKHLVKYKYTLVLTLLIIASILYLDGNFRIHTIICRLLLGVVSFIASISLCSQIKSKVVSCILQGVVCSFFLFLFIYIILYRQLISYDVIASVVGTNIQEIISYIGEIGVLIVIPFLLIILFIFSSRELRNDSPFSLRKSVLILVLVTITPVLLFDAKTVVGDRGKSYSEILEKLRFSYSLGINEKLGQDIHSLSVYNPVALVFYINAVIQEHISLNNYYSIDQVIENGLIPEMDSNSPSTIMLIIGESASSMHFSSYGYPKSTTPFVNSLSPDIRAQYDAITSFQYTRTAVPSLLTNNNACTLKSEILKVKNIIHLAEDLGYETVWISNQGMGGRYEGEISLLAHTCNYEWFSSPNQQKEDFNLIEPFKDYYNPTKKQFIILHLIGSHVSFHDKYDSEDAKYLQSKTIVDEYDCSIHHTDRVLKEIYSHLTPDNSDYIMLYVSDHGENPHSVEGRYSKDGYSFYVPFIVISDKYIELIDSISSQYISGKYLNTSNTYYILAELMGYKVANKLKEKARQEGHYVKFKNSMNQATHYREIPYEQTLTERKK